MPITGRGATATLKAIVRNGSGTLADATSIDLIIKDDTDTALAGFPVSLPVISHTGLGAYSYAWAVAPDQPKGNYMAYWTAVVEGLTVYGQESVEVIEAGSVSPAPVPLAGPYVTPGRFRTMDLGPDVSGKTDLQLASTLARASTVVESYCTVSMYPAKHDFRGGSVVNEEHVWRYPEGIAASTAIGTRRAYPYHWPIRNVNRFRIYVTNTQFVEIKAADLFIQNSDRYVEVVSLALTSSGLFNALIIPNVGLATPTLRMDYDYGFEFPLSGEEIYPAPQATVSGGETYQAANQWWTDDPVTVYLDGTPQDATDYDVDRREGTVTFTTPPSGVVTIDYTHRLPWEIREAVALIACYELGQSSLASRGLLGLESLKISDQLALTRVREMRSSGAALTADNLDRLVPEAADLLSGFKFWRVA